MAQASAKKAAAARSAAASFYQPFLLIFNAIYLLFLIYWRQRRQTPDTFFSAKSIGLVAIYWSIQYYAYTGILENNATTATSSNSNNKNKSALAGGVYLDILGLVLLVQLAAIFYSAVNWLLLMLPFWGIKSLIAMAWPLLSGRPSGGGTTTSIGDEAATSNQKSHKRAEKRRQKWT